VEAAGQLQVGHLSTFHAFRGLLRTCCVLKLVVMHMIRGLQLNLMLQGSYCVRGDRLITLYWVLPLLLLMLQDASESAAAGITSKAEDLAQQIEPAAQQAGEVLKGAAQQAAAATEGGADQLAEGLKQAGHTLGKVFCILASHCCVMFSVCCYESWW
jgi:hypothetical protein